MSFPSPELQGSSSLVCALMTGEEKEFQSSQPSPQMGHLPGKDSLYPSSKNLSTGHILAAHSPRPGQV